jgi:hypothetical protein
LAGEVGSSAKSAKTVNCNGEILNRQGSEKVGISCFLGGRIAEEANRSSTKQRTIRISAKGIQARIEKSRQPKNESAA